MLCLRGNAPIGYACIWRANRSHVILTGFSQYKSLEKTQAMPARTGTVGPPPMGHNIYVLFLSLWLPSRLRQLN